MCQHIRGTHNLLAVHVAFLNDKKTSFYCVARVAFFPSFLNPLLEGHFGHP